MSGIIKEKLMGIYQNNVCNWKVIFKKKVKLYIKYFLGRYKYLKNYQYFQLLYF